MTQCTGEAREATAIRIIDSDPEDAKLTIALRFVLTDHLTSGDLFGGYSYRRNRSLAFMVHYSLINNNNRSQTPLSPSLEKFLDVGSTSK